MIFINEGYKNNGGWYKDSKDFITFGIGFELNSFITHLKNAERSI